MRRGCDRRLSYRLRSHPYIYMIDLARDERVGEPSCPMGSAGTRRTHKTKELPLNASGKNYVLISSDTHAGGSMEMYKGYLSRQYHDEFDRWAAEFHDGWGEFDQNVGEGADPAIRFGAASFLSEYNWDSPRRLQHLEQDGVVAEVVDPNTVPPFYPAAVLSAPHPAPATTHSGGPVSRRTTAGWSTSAMRCPAGARAWLRCFSTTSTQP